MHTRKPSVERTKLAVEVERVEIDQCTGSSLTGAGHGHRGPVVEFFHDYMAWFRQQFTPNG